MKRKNLLTSFCLSVLFLLLGNAGWAEKLVCQTGFEYAESFMASTTYNNNHIFYHGKSGKQWGTYYGTASNTSPITGGQSMQIHWYPADSDRMGYTFTHFDIANATKVVFKAKSTNGINVICSFSSDGGATYMGEETFTLDGNPGEYTYNISATGAYANVRVKFQITYTTAPSDISYLYIDDVRIYAAGTDETAPTFASGYPTANVLFTSLDAFVKTDEPCTVYYKVVADGATAPTVDEVIDNNETITVEAANTEYSSSITGLTAETAYDIYFVAKDAAENTQATATKVDVTTFSTDTKILIIDHNTFDGLPILPNQYLTIMWTSYNCESENIKIELYIPQNDSWNEMVSSTANDGSETITIPLDATYATTYKLRISLVSDATVNSTSGDFTVLSLTSIYNIQYTTAADGASPLVDQIVSVLGVVTAVDWNDNYNNGDFTVQGGPGLYSAINVFRSATRVAIGDLVMVTGPIAEYNGLTVVVNNVDYADVYMMNGGNTVPTPIEVSTLDANGECYESMLVKVSNVVCDGTVLNDGSGNLNFYNKFGVDYTFEETAHYDIIGIILCDTSGPQICPRTASDISITNDVEVNPFDTFSAYPNPFNNEIRFAGSDVKRVTIVSVVGSVLYDNAVTDNELINTSDIPSGLYLVRFTNSLGQSTIKKMIKK